MKALADMDLAELHVALQVEQRAVEAAEYQDGLAAYQRVKGAALGRLRAVEAEIDKRLAGPGQPEKVASQHG